MEPIVIPPVENEPQFAVAWINNGNVVIVGPEDYCRRYCGRANEDETVPFYHVVPYVGEKFRGSRHPSSSFTNDLNPITPKVYIGVTITDAPSTKDKVREYLAKLT